jgi:hypothetical protein
MYDPIVVDGVNGLLNSVNLYLILRVMFILKHWHDDEN